MKLPRSLIAITAVLLALRLYAAKLIGFGDSEALYATYALHPSLTYLDHPGFIGFAAHLLSLGGLGSASGTPAPDVLHAASAVISTAFPILFFTLTRSAGASERRAEIAAGLVAVTPEIAIGLYGFTPDLFLAPAWLGALWLWIRWRQSETPSKLTFALLLTALAATAKVTALLLWAGILVDAILELGRSDNSKTKAPIRRALLVGVGGSLLLLAPFVWAEAAKSFPMLRHRLVASQGRAGFSLRNLAAVPLGQIAYLSPFIAFILGRGVVGLAQSKPDAAFAPSSIRWLLIGPLAILGVFSLWSTVAEPHWLAPAWLTVAFFLTLSDITFPRWLLRASFALASVLTLAVHAWVLAPRLHQFFPAPAEAKHDISNELFGWTDATARLDELRESYPGATIVGPHWTICAQLQATMGARVAVGCATEIPDDFDRWVPRDRWKSAQTIIWVTDQRFPSGMPEGRHTIDRRRLTTFRGGRLARTFEFTVLDRDGSEPHGL